MLISIITVNYNNVEGLERTIRSVQEQSYEQIEHLVIDGGSDDGSLEIIKNYTSHLGYWVSEPDDGPYHAMNKGIEKANGEYLLFLNSGDYLFSSTVLEEINHSINGEDIIYGNLQIESPKGTWVKKYPAKLGFYFLSSETLPHPASFIKKEVFGELGGYSLNYKIVSDWEFFLVAIVIKKMSYKHIEIVTSVFHLDGISSNSENQNLIKEETQRVIEKHFKMDHLIYAEFLQMKRFIQQIQGSKFFRIMKFLGRYKNMQSLG